MGRVGDDHRGQPTGGRGAVLKVMGGETWRKKMKIWKRGGDDKR